MDNQNQPSPEQTSDPNPPNSPVPAGGQRVIQPTEAILNHVQTQSSVMPTQEPRVIQPGSNINTSNVTPEPAPLVTPVFSTPSPPQTLSPTSNIGISGNELARAAEAKRGRKRMIKVGISVIVLIAVGAAGLAFRTPLIALLPSKYTTYTYPPFHHVEPFKFTVNFYKNSRLVEWATPAPPGSAPIAPTPTLMSPVQQGISAMILEIRVGPLNSTNKGAINAVSTCSQTGQSVGPTIQIPSLQANAAMCQSTALVNGKTFTVGYIGGVISPATNSTMYIELTSNYSYQTSPLAITHALNLQDYQSEVQHIVSSIKYVKQ